MYEQSSREELIELIGQLNERIYDLTEKNANTFVPPSPPDESAAEFLECERKAHQEANEAEIESLKEELEFEKVRSSELQAQIADYERQMSNLNGYKSQHEELVTMIKDQQSLITTLESQLSDRKALLAPTGSSEVDQLYLRIQGLELELKRKEEERLSLEEELKSNQSYYQSEMSRLATQLASPIQRMETDAMIYTNENAKLKAETMNNKQAMMSMSASLQREIQDHQRLQNELMTERTAFRQKLAEKEELLTTFSITLDSLKTLLACDHAEVVPSVKHLFYERDAARQALDERVAIERKLGTVVLENERLKRELERMTMMKTTSSFNQGQLKQLEDENRRLRGELADVKQKLATKPPPEIIREGNEACVNVARQLTEYSDVTPMIHVLTELFACLANQEDYQDALDRVVTAAAGPDPNDMMNIIVETSFNLVKEYWDKHSDIVGGLNDKITDLYAKLDRLNRKIQDRVMRERRLSLASTSSRSSTGSSRIPTLTKRPLAAKNQFGFGKAFEIPGRMRVHEPSRRNIV